MDAKKIFFLVLLALSCSALSYGLPNDAASSNQHLSTVASPHSPLFNIPASKYIVELYNAITSNPMGEAAADNANAIANSNTIRSCPYSPTAGEHGLLNFVCAFNCVDQSFPLLMGAETQLYSCS